MKLKKNNSSLKKEYITSRNSMMYISYMYTYYVIVN